MATKTEYTGKYKISKFDLGFAKWYSLKYMDWMEEYNSLKDSVRSASYGEIHGSKVSNPTEELATKRAELRNKMLKVENAAFDAGDDIADYLLKYVIDDTMTFERLEKMGIPCGRTYFYEKRRKYYYLLAKEI